MWWEVWVELGGGIWMFTLPPGQPWGAGRVVEGIPAAVRVLPGIADVVVCQVPD